MIRFPPRKKILQQRLSFFGKIHFLGLRITFGDYRLVPIDFALGHVLFIPMGVPD
jgi:hypothetical protein